MVFYSLINIYVEIMVVIYKNDN